jgi:hypothetical protein
MKTKQLVLSIGLALGSGFAQAVVAPTLDVVAPATVSFPGLVWDSGQQLTWLQDTNWNPNLMTWQEATDWAAGLSVTYNGQTYADWRLPTTAEMQYLRDNYTSNGLPIGTGYGTSPVTDPGPFLVGQFISTATADAWGKETQMYMDMDANGGIYGPTGTSLTMLTWGAVMVPEPEAYAMLLAGLGLIGFVARRRRANL